MSLKNLSTVSFEEQKQFIESFDIILSDVDGIVWMIGSIYGDSPKEVEYLRTVYQDFIFVSNNSVLGTEAYVNRLKMKGFGEKPTLVHPVLAIIQYLKNLNFEKEIYIIGADTLKDQIRDAGLKVNEEKSVTLDARQISTWTEHLIDNPDIGAVLLDWDPNVSFLKLQKAITYLKRKDVLFLTGATDLKLPITKDLIFAGPGYFQQIVQDISGRTPISLSKPSSKLNDYLIKEHGITNPSRTLFIGDSISQDMGFAANCGYKKLLVLTGVAQQSDVDNWTEEERFKPDYYVDSFLEFYKIVKSIKN